MVLTILGAVFMLAICIFIHELGHLLCGMVVGVEAKIFSIGYGKGIWKKKIGNTIWQITSIPLGGYVQFKGEEYGKVTGEKGELMGVPPLKRMFPVLGGPLFNLILGFIILFFLELFNPALLTNKIYIDPGIESFSPAYKAGLRSGDSITNINGEVVRNFEDLVSKVSLSKGEELEIVYESNGVSKTSKFFPIVSPSGRPSIGVEVWGDRRVEVSFTYSESLRYWLNAKLDPKGDAQEFFEKKNSAENSQVSPDQTTQLNSEQTKQLSPDQAKQLSPEQVKQLKGKSKEQFLRERALKYLNDGDVILSVNATQVHSIFELQTELGKNRDKTVQLKVSRKKYPILTPFAREEVTVEIPVLASEVIKFSNLKNSKFSELNVPRLEFYSHDPEIQTFFSNFTLNGKKVQSVADLEKSKGEVDLKIGNLEYSGNLNIRNIGLLGFRPNIQFKSEDTGTNQSVWGAVVGATDKVYQTIVLSLKGIGMLFQGFISPKDGLSGPVGIVSMAGATLETGWAFYFDFVARISLSLMIMNLLPIPLADGGHILLYAIEAVIGRPVPQKIVETIFKFGFLFLMSLLFYVTFYDMLRIFD